MSERAMFGEREAWEYRVVSFGAHSIGYQVRTDEGWSKHGYPSDELNALGAEGWELVSAAFDVEEFSRRFVCVLKRRKVD